MTRTHDGLTDHGPTPAARLNGQTTDPAKWVRDRSTRINEPMARLIAEAQSGSADHQTTRVVRPSRVRAAWSALRGRSTDVTQTTRTTVDLPDHSDHWVQPVLTVHSPAPVHPTQADRTQTTRQRGAWLRWVPPIASLGTAFVLQVIVITDTVGTVLAARYSNDVLPAPAWFGFAALLGLAVASCIEGSAAYVLDLYDKHLLARDSVLGLRIAMLVYVALSAGIIHWWAGQRHLPSIISWALAAMAGSSMFLWTIGSKWKHRVQMKANGQLDPAAPRLSVMAKVFHPIRWIITQYLISWNPAGSPAEARQRYDDWKNGPHWWTGIRLTHRTTSEPKVESGPLQAELVMHEPGPTTAPTTPIVEPAPRRRAVESGSLGRAQTIVVEPTTAPAPVARESGPKPTLALVHGSAVQNLAAVIDQRWTTDVSLPSRQKVMDHMKANPDHTAGLSWTSARQVGQALNLVREQRAENNETEERTA